MQYVDDVVNIQMKIASEYLISNNSYIQNKATMATKELLPPTQWGVLKECTVIALW